MNLNQRLTEKTKLLLEKERLRRLLLGESVSLNDLVEEAVVDMFGSDSINPLVPSPTA